MSPHRMAASTTAEPLIFVDRTLILFDLDQPQDAKQMFRIKKIAGSGVVGWRILCNAPTRYIVKPNGGLLQSDQEVQIQLVRNRFNLQHVMVIEAIGFEDEKRWPGIWTSQLKTDRMQVIELDLSTTLINIDSTSRLTAALDHPILSQMMELSQTKGGERVKELKELLVMLKTDSQTLDKNIEQTRQLIQTLKEQLATKQTQVLEEKKKTLKLEKKLAEAKADWEQRQRGPDVKQGPDPSQKTATPCCIM